MVVEPISYEEAQGKYEWEKAMEKEITIIEKNDTWELVDLSSQTKEIGVNWVYKVKYKLNGIIQKYKVRLVVKGYVQ